MEAEIHGSRLTDSLRNMRWNRMIWPTTLVSRTWRWRSCTIITTSRVRIETCPPSHRFVQTKISEEARTDDAEEVMFPAMERACNDPSHRLTKNIEEHAVFANQLNAAWIYIRTCRSSLTPTPSASPVPPPSEEDLKVDPAKWGLDPKLGFQPKVFRAEMDKWLIPLVEHLDEEIATLEPAWIEKMGEKELNAQRKVVDKYLQSYDPAWFLVSTVGESVETRANGWIDGEGLIDRFGAARDHEQPPSSAIARPQDPRARMSSSH